MEINLKQHNISEIDKFIENHFNTTIQGTKLHALYNLIQRKGKRVESKENSKLNGKKVLEYKPGNYICLDRTGSKKSFFPCSISVIQLVDIN
jgi:hypothetical protein